MKTFILYGSCGEMIVDTDGNVLEHIAYPYADMDGYANIIRIDVGEWRDFYPNEQLEGGSWDVLDFGGWLNTDQYFNHCREAFEGAI